MVKKQVMDKCKLWFDSRCVSKFGCALDVNNKSLARICENHTILEAMLMEKKYVSVFHGFVSYHKYWQGTTADCSTQCFFRMVILASLACHPFLQFHMCLHKMSSQTSMADDSGKFKHSLSPLQASPLVPSNSLSLKYKRFLSSSPFLACLLPVSAAIQSPTQTPTWSQGQVMEAWQVEREHCTEITTKSRDCGEMESYRQVCPQLAPYAIGGE